MNVAALTTPISGAVDVSRYAPAIPDGDSFESALRDAASTGGGFDEEAARTAAQQFVASALILPVFQQMRQSTTATGPFAPGQAERRFGPLLDERLADQVSRATNFTLVDSIVDRLRHSATGVRA